MKLRTLLALFEVALFVQAQRSTVETEVRKHHPYKPEA